MRSIILHLVDCESLTDEGWIIAIPDIASMCAALDSNGDWQGMTLLDRPYVEDFARRMLSEAGEVRRIVWDRMI